LKTYYDFKNYKTEKKLDDLIKSKIILGKETLEKLFALLP
jgi:hypothetical protein